MSFPPPPRYRWAMLTLGFFFTTVFALGLQEVPPILGLIMDELNLNYVQAGSLMSGFTVTGLFFSVGWGLLLSKYGTRRMGWIIILLFIGGNLASAFAVDYLSLLISRFVAGMGAQAMAIIGASIVSKWFRGKELGLALGIYTSAVPLGTILALNTYGIVGLALGWRTAILLTVGIGVLLFIAFAIVYREAPSVIQQFTINIELMYRVMRLILPVGLLWMFFQAAGGAYMTFAPGYFVSIGYPLQIATLMTSFWMLGSLLFSPMLGKILDRVGHIPLAIVIGGIILVIGFFVLPLLPHSTFIVVVFFAVFAPLIPVSVFALTPQKLEAHETSLGFSVLANFTSIGLAAGPLITGALTDLSGGYTLAFHAMGLFAFGTVVTAMFLMRKRDEIKEEPILV
ncbi:MAG: MFS transporter [Candidatus Ranarchaeia archaeon]